MMEQSAQFSPRDLPLASCRPDPNQPRKRFDGIELLAASMLTAGVIQPIVVRPDPEREGEFLIILGERRWRAASIAGLTTIPAFLRSDIPSDRIFFTQFIDSLEDYRHPLEAREKALALQAHVEQVGVEKACEELGQKKDWISRETALAKVQDDIWELAAEQKITDRRTILDLSRLVKHTGKPAAAEWESVKDLGPSKRAALHARMEASGVKKKRAAKSAETAESAPDQVQRSGTAADAPAIGKGANLASGAPIALQVDAIEPLPASRPRKFRRKDLDARIQKAGEILGVDPEADFEGFLDALLSTVAPSAHVRAEIAGARPTHQ